MLNGRKLTTLIVIVVLLNLCRIDGGRIRGTRDSKVTERHIGDGRDGFSGDGSHVDLRDLHYHIQGEKTLKERKEIDPEDEDGYVEFSGQGSDIEELHVHDKEARHLKRRYPVDDEDAKTPWEHFKMHLHSHGKEDGEFGYITNEEEVDSEDNDDDVISGERDYDHEHIKILHVHRRVKSRDDHVEGRSEQEINGGEDEEYGDEESGEGEHEHIKTLHVHRKVKSRDNHVKGRTEQEINGEEDEDEGYEDEESGEDSEDFNVIYDRDLQRSEGNNEQDQSEGSVMAEDEEDEMNLSGEEELSARDEETTSGEKESEERKKEGKEKTITINKQEPDYQMKNAERKNKLGNNKKAPKKNIIREKLQKFSSSKKKGSKVDTVSHRSQNLKVHAELDFTHKKTTDISPKETTAKKNKVRSGLKKTRKDLNTVKDSQTGQENGLNNVEDFYIDEDDGPKRRMFVVEMRDAVDRKDQGEDMNPGRRKINKRSLNEDGRAVSIQGFRRGNSRHLLQFSNMSEPLDTLPVPSSSCSHPALTDTMTDQSIVYIRAECRLCQCKMGQLICNAKPEQCDQQYAKTCSMAKGELTDGETHFDGCNKCICRNGELLCTRVRCSSSSYNYTNYRTSAASENTLENTSMNIVDDGIIRDKDWCMECDSEPVSPVCGPNWKTYRSMCHAFHCGGFDIKDVKQGKCEYLHPCDGVKCAEHEICVADLKGPCLATKTRDGDVIECPQHQCVSPSEKLNCSSALVEKTCGEDNKSYINECQMLGKGVALAYYGSCRDECLTYDARMCGVDGVNYKSICHASRHNSHVDYPGQCDEVDPKIALSKSSAFVTHFNPRCQIVTDLARCPEVNCVNRVIPEGSCCPVCGASISIRLDIAARDMISLNANVKPLKDLNRLDVILAELKNLSNQFGGLGKCQLTIDLVDTHDVSVVYKPISAQDDDACQRVAVKTVEFVNSPAKSDVEPAKALLAVAIIKERENHIGLPRAESLMSKWRIKRDQHHEHEPFFNKSNRICLQNNLMLLAALAFVLVYKLTEF